MTDNKDTGGGTPPPEPTATDGTDGAAEAEERTPRRVIGTPSPAESRRLLATDDGGEAAAGPQPGEDIDEAQARKAERIVATLFVITFLASLGFIVVYVLSGRNGGMHGVRRAMWSNYGLGATMTIAFLAMAAGITIWFRRLMTAKQIIQERGDLTSDAESRQAFTQNFMQGATDSGITRRPLLRRTLLLAAAPLGLAPLVLLRDLGPLPEKKLRHTYWREAVEQARRQGRQGARLVVDGTYTPLRRSDFESPGGMITVVPEGIDKLPNILDEVAKAATIVINIPQDKFQPVKGRENWHVGGIVAYSKICTHVGCPAALYEQTTHHILCPCHQSTFDATKGAKVIFGPAARPLPQLPIGVDDQGYLIALSDYDQPVGPSFWERG
ncbi:MAG TPA: Rieske 2Fe-2S domain-containing protein [Streptosporangiaceae bacterium]|nr:Rieske 2Fe-2S domain-containing protein [Streptosporangiaceae bacterium]